MKLYTTLFKRILALIIVSVTVYSCNDYNDLNLETPSGDADFSTVVAVGNSLTAGYQSNALFETAQRYSYPALVAGQIETVQNFEQPLISDPGIGGRIGLNDSLSNPMPTEEQGSPVNADLGRPYNNLGIPGAILADFLGRDLGVSNTYSGRRSNNPFFDIVLRDFGDTQVDQVAALEPTFAMFWLGNNDILGYVINGGTSFFVHPTIFAELYEQSLRVFWEWDTDVVLYNIPDVTSIPFVFYLRAQLEQQQVISLNETSQSYQLNTAQGALDIYIETANGTRVMRQNDFLLLSASDYFASVQAGDVAPPVSPADAIPNNLVLDGPVTTPPTGNSEVAQASAVAQQYNSIISSAASNNGYALVDINSVFNNILSTFQATGTYQVDGVTLRPVPGELFSFDGIHPGNRGQGIIANSTIDAINNFYGADLQNIDISAIPQGIPINN